MFIIDDILFLPLQPVLMVAKKIDELVKKELYDEDRIKENLMQLQLKLDLGQISQEEYARQEEDLLARLNQVLAERGE
ncbi:gas vesicle protein GvpG [Candidatus Saganbacteria bacterium]|nr:gas vesicle protein GvpG [Candidatus Saganbacteria bacterium]